MSGAQMTRAAVKVFMDAFYIVGLRKPIPPYLGASIPQEYLDEDNYYNRKMTDYLYCALNLYQRKKNEPSDNDQED